MGLFERFRRARPAVGDGSTLTTQTSAVAYFDAGNTHFRSGSPDAALDAFRKALASKPDFAEVEVAIGSVFQQLGNLEEAVASYRRAIQINPNYHEAFSKLGDALMPLGQFEAAAASYERAIELGPASEVAHFNLGNALLARGSLDNAAASYIRALKIKPDFATAHCNLGNVLRGLGRTNDAIASYERAVQIAPQFAEAHYNLGVTLQGVARHDDAIASYNRALRIKPDLAQAHNNLGNALKMVGRVDDALASYRSALQCNANYAEAHNNLGTALQKLGRIDEAVSGYRRAIEIKPEFAEAHNNLGNALTDLGRIVEALTSYRSAIAIKPDYAEVHSNLGNALSKLWQLDAAIVSYQRALQVDPNCIGAHNNLGNALQELGCCDDAAASFRRALEIKPDFAEAHSSLLFCLSHDGGIDPQALFAEHCRFGAQFEAPVRASWPKHRNDRNAERPLQIGVVSGDLRDHAVAYFFEPILEHLAAHAGLSLHAYYNHAIEGSITPRLRSHFDAWHRISGLSDAALAQKIGADGIDILIDLSGHTSENRLSCFASKPAPVQASWMGYPGTTGLSAMDYYLADGHFLPPGEFDSQFTEKLVYLPASAPFLPDRRAPPVNSLPALSNGYLTFGSFNRLGKLTPSAIALWSRLLQALPEARMLLGGMPQDGQSGMLVDWFARGGVARNRLSFYPRCDVADYLAMHGHVDICLDTFPYTGGTTTNHALWMGVPTLTLAGRTAPGRQGAAILGHVRLDAFVADNADDFLKRGRSWAGDLAALSAIRSGLRQRCEQSPIRNPELIAAGLENALRTMWRRWCAGLPAETFEAVPQQPVS